jgi:hypothetical protein
MRKKRKFARVARLVYEIAEFLKAAIAVISLLIEIVNKAANCNADQLPVQISVAR